MESKLLRPLSQAILLALAATGAHAANLTVTDGGDAGTASTCTLRQAIDSANNDSATGSTCVAGSGADAITFAAGLTNSTITLAAGQLDITSSVTLTGSGQTIDANSNSRVMSIYGNASVAVTISNLTMTGGSYYGEGGGGGLSISYRFPAPPPRSLGKAPRASTTPSGPSVALEQVVIDNNKAGFGAGGVYVNDSTVSIDRSTISNNTLKVTGSYEGGAGGIDAGESSGVTITNSTISGNSASGGQNYVYLTGGAAFKYSQITVTNSTISGNSASGNNFNAGGMSLSVYSNATISDSTISGNTAANANVAAGGILVSAAQYNPDQTTNLTLYNTILSGNSGIPNADLGVGNNANVIAQSNLLGTALDSYTGNTFSDAPGLGALANNGGPTLTMALQPGSPAIGAGNVALIPPGVTTDQRGVGFPRTADGKLDLGAVQVAAAAPAVAAVPTPTLSTWGLSLLGGLLALFGLRKRKRADG